MLASHDCALARSVPALRVSPKHDTILQPQIPGTKSVEPSAQLGWLHAVERAELYLKPSRAERERLQAGRGQCA
jgi:hypothetical protein